jgi:hypothetical protein
MVELPLDRGQVVEDVRVVELEIVQDRGARTVMDELAALVEEGGVVLVGLDHEGRERTRCVAQPGGHVEVERHAAHQETGLQPGVLQDPGQHGGGRGLAVRAGDGQHVAALQHMLRQPLRAAGVGQSLVQDRFHQGVFRGAVRLAGA